MNCLNSSQVKQLLRIFEVYEVERGWSSTVLRANGNFCAGHNMLELLRTKREGDMNQVLEIYSQILQLNFMLWRSKKPVVACFDGLTLGTGASLVLNCAWRVASPEAVWALPETSMGLMPFGAVTELRKLPNPGLGYYLALTGRRLKGGDLVHAGIATHLSTPAGFLVLEEALAALDTDLNSTAFLDRLHESEVPLPVYTLEPELAHIQEHFAFGYDIDGLKESLKQAGTPWALNTLKRLEARSPAALLATHMLFQVASVTGNSQTQLAAEMGLMRNLLANFEDPWEGLIARVRDQRPPVWAALPENAMNLMLATGPNPMEKVLRNLRNYDRPGWADQLETWRQANPELGRDRLDAKFFATEYGQSLLQEAQMNIAEHTPYTHYLDSVTIAQSGEENWFQ